MIFVNFTDAARTSASGSPEGLRYLGVALYGGKKVFIRLTGSCRCSGSRELEDRHGAWSWDLARRFDSGSGEVHV